MAQPKSSPSRKGGGKAAAKRPPEPPPEEVRANIAALRDRLVTSVTLSTDRVQELTDDLVRRGRMTRGDAEQLFTSLVSSGRSQTEALISDLEQLLGRSRTRAGARVMREVDRARREVDKARRVVGGGAFPIGDYDDLTAAQITSRLGDLTPADLRKIRDYERRNANRKSVLAAVEKALR